MKSTSITCIICGSFVFVAPMLYHFGSFALCAYAVANTRLTPMNISAPVLEESYRIGSMCFGLSLTVVGIVLALLSRRAVPSDTPRKDTLTPAGLPTAAA